MKRLENFSRFMSYILRHNSHIVEKEMDKQGWIRLDFFTKFFAHRYDVSIEEAEKEINSIVKNDEKGRYQISDSLPKKIRACQGHSVIKIDFKEADPPEFLYHGTTIDFLNSILENGLKPMSRHHVHLSVDKESAKKVGQRYGKPVVITIQAKKMKEDGYKFFLSENNIWLVDFVPSKYIMV